MDPITLSLILMGVGGAIKGGTQLGFGLSDKAKGRKMEEEAGDRPDYTVPPSVDKAIQMYQQMAQTGLPGEDLMKGDIQASTARTAGIAGQLSDSPVGALTALGGAQQRELSAMRDLQMRAAQYQSQMQQNYAQAVGNRANYEQEAWRQNELLPWEIQMNRAMDLQTKGKGNVMGAADSFGSTISQMGGFIGQNAMYSNMYPTWGNGGGGSQNPNQFIGPPAYDYGSLPQPQPWAYQNQQNLPYY